MQPSIPHRLAIALATLALAASSGAGQERDVVREVYYNFFDSNLTIRVDTEASGQLRLIRGRNSRIEVAGRADDGIASFGLDDAGRRSLTLTALGSATVDFVVEVPEQVRVHVHLPGYNRTELFGSMRASATYAWDEAGPERASIRTWAPEEPAAARTGQALETVYRGATPLRPRIPEPGLLSSVAVRIEGRAFQIRGGGSVQLRPAGNDLVLDGASDDARLIILVPRTTSAFTLRMDGADALILENGFAQPLCDPVTEQHLQDGRSWFTFTPATGMRCRPEADPAPGRST